MKNIRKYSLFSIFFLCVFLLVACVTHTVIPNEPHDNRRNHNPLIPNDSLKPNSSSDPVGSKTQKVPDSEENLPLQNLTNSYDGGLDSDIDGEDDVIDDGFEEDIGNIDSSLYFRPKHPLAHLSDSDLKTLYSKNPLSVGPISLGKIRGGMLINGIQMPEGDGWIVRAPQAAWGTQETVDSIQRAITMVRKQFSDTPKLYIGHLSRKRGGRFLPHISHQNGRDADLGFYYLNDENWYSRANAKNLDRPRTWALVRTLITETDVELILIDRSILTLLKDYALTIGEDRHWLDQLFGGSTATLRPVLRHARGHATHIHVRFFSPIARETARRLYAILLKTGKIRPPTYYIRHRARKGHTLAYMARRYRTTIRAIRGANRIRGNLIREGRYYKIPRRGGVAKGPTDPLVVPPRRLPPAPQEYLSAEK